MSKKNLFKIPRVKIGGLHISSKGVSASIKTKAGTYNTRKGWTSKKSGFGAFLDLLLKLLK